MYQKFQMNQIVINVLLIMFVSHGVAVNLAFASAAYKAEDFNSFPVNIVENAVKPRVMINSSNDHQLFFKAYNDYSDLDGDGVPETTYKHSFNYYGYFDSFKCYSYDTVDNRFEPKSFTTDKYCGSAAGTGEWSGNFLNWVSTSRIDAIRKILFGGHRRLDTSNDTTLERSYLPHDAHSWAKYYAGADIEKLTPFRRGTDYYCDNGDAAGCTTGGVLDKKMIGLTFGNTTDVNAATYGANVGSEKYTEPPLIKVVKGNYSLWASNERWQVTWASGAPMDNHTASNANDSSLSSIHAYATSPAWSERVGVGNYMARVQACVKGLIDSDAVAAVNGSTKEKCKLYPGPDGISGTNDDNYKPIGLLQTYGDDDRMYFGMVAGSYQKHAAGGDLIRNAETFTQEVKVNTDGTFPLVANFAGGPLASNANGDGLVNAWSLYRIVRYDGKDGTYNNLDNCPWALSKLGDITKDNQCQNWGNPFAEIYYQSINYLAGAGVIGDYRSNSSTGIPGLPTPPNFKDPLDGTSYCAPLSVVNLNSSIVSYDYDQLDDQSYGVKKLWDPAILPGDKTSTAMTDAVGKGEGIHSNKYLVGQVNLGGAGDNQLCTEKNITSLGKTGGICPEAPRLYGSYRIAGLAYYAHTKDIRPDTHNSRKLAGNQVVDTYGVALATGLPVIEIPNLSSPSSKPLATIVPACRNASLNPEGNCSIVDFKIISQKVEPGSVSGKVYMNWEDSEQGGDFDQDMWGTLEYELDTATKILTITTKVHDVSTPYKMGFGYIVSGSTGDGFHVHSGINGYTYSDTADGSSCNDQNGCNVGDIASSKKYTLSGTPASLLKDPLWYASKWGGFVDSNGNNLPDLQEEWDSKINATGTTGSDGIPDNYYFAANPRQLEDSLDRVFKAILERTSSGTAAAVVSSNVSGEGALYQAYYEPLKKNDDKEARWLGTVQALWLDSFGLTRQDCSPPSDSDGVDINTGKCLPVPSNVSGGICVPNHRLDNYCVDQVVETYYDTLENRTRTRIFESDVPESYTAYSMQGVVKTSSNGAITTMPNSMEGRISYNDSSKQLVITPYTMSGKVISYDPDTGSAVIKVTAWTGPSGGAFSLWEITSSTSAAEGFSSDTITPAIDSTFSFTVAPAGPWITVGDELSFKTKNTVGATGQVFSDWTIKCLEGNSAGDVIDNIGIQLSNSQEETLNVSLKSEFISCSRATLASYNLKGTSGKTYNSWKVSNLTTLDGKGASTSALVLGNDGERSFVVTPAINWLSAGDSVLVSSNTYITKELYDIGYLWNAREALCLPSVDLMQNRSWLSQASTGRYIKSWVDVNLDGIVGSGEFLNFEDNMFPSVSHSFFDVNDINAAKKVVNYVRGVEIADSRNRTIRYSENAPNQVMRLGDIVNSTPAVVGPPQEAYDLLYDDSTYRTFRQQYINRRIMIYTGANDGLIHAFNGGFYNKVTINKGKADEKSYIEYSTDGKDFSGKSATSHPLGGEVWAYAPYNLLSHLQWLQDKEYGKKTHVYYVDGKPRIFDAKIFADDAEHPHGWGTVMVVGMNLGGGIMEFDVDHDSDAATAKKKVKLQSAYVIFDVTNPEEPPRMLAEIKNPDNSFTTVYPAVVSFKDSTDNRWYLMFGTGPNDMDMYTSSQNAKIYLFDLLQLKSQLPSPVVGSVVPANCSVNSLNSKYNVLSCDTNKVKSFIGTPSVVDWNLDFKADSAYFGTIGYGTTAGVQDDGVVFRLGFNNQSAISAWNGLQTFYNPGKPVVAQPVPAIDDIGKHWIYFGTGRYFSSQDKLTADAHYLYGIKDPENGVYPVASSKILDVSNVEVFTDGTLAAPTTSTVGTPLASFPDIVKEIDNNASGWKMYLPPIVGLSTDPSARSITRPALLGGVLFSSVFQPSSNPCAGEGHSRLYGMYYKTGTAYPSKPVFGTSVEQVNGTLKYRARKFVDLGRGVSTTPAIHSGRGSGDDGLKVFTQLSTGEIVESQAETINKIRTGRTSWREK